MAAYEVLLLNTAIPQIQAAQSGDTYLVPRDIAFSAALTLSAGTANGVPYLNASKVLTTGSALTFDGTNLGVGGTATDTNSYGRAVDAIGTNGAVYYARNAGGNTIGFFGAYFGAFNTVNLGSTTNSDLVFYRQNSEQMRLTSTGLGIGTSSPAGRLSVKGSTSNSSANAFFVEDSSSAGIFRVRNDGDIYMGNGGKAILDSSGNLGLGVTPSAWTNVWKVVEGGRTGNAFVTRTGGGRAILTSNAIFGASSDTYANNGAAAYFDIDANSFKFFTAPSGTANSASVTSGASYIVVALGSSTLAQWQAFFNDSSNNPLTVTPTLGQVLTGNATGTLLGGGLVTQNISFTQAMTLDASGNLLVGTTTSSAKVSLQYSGASAIGQDINDADDQANSTFVQFRVQGTQAGTIKRVASTSAVVYNTTSDYRLKNVVGAVTGQGSRIDALKPIDYQWKQGNTPARGFLAHEFQEVYPSSVSGTKDAVDAEGKPVYQAMQASTSEVIADLVAELQSLRARVAQLEQGA